VGLFFISPFSSCSLFLKSLLLTQACTNFIQFLVHAYQTYPPPPCTNLPCFFSPILVHAYQTYPHLPCTNLPCFFSHFGTCLLNVPNTSMYQFTMFLSHFWYMLTKCTQYKHVPIYHVSLPFLVHASFILACTKSQQN